MKFESLGAALPKVTGAECRGGLLYVADLADTVFKPIIIPGKNYHGLDYPLFHMDIRKNVSDRVKVYLLRALTDNAAPKPHE